MRQIISIVLLIAGCATVAAGQSKASAASDQKLRSTPAYAEVLLRETELRADVEALLADYTEEYPKVKESRFALDIVEREKARLLLTKPAEAEKLTLALGKIVVRKVDAEVELWRLLQSLADGHPDVKRARRKVEIFEKAIKEILG